MDGAGRSGVPVGAATLCDACGVHDCYTPITAFRFDGTSILSELATAMAAGGPLWLARSAAAGAPATASASASAGRAGRRAAAARGDRDCGQKFDRVGMSPGAGRRLCGIAHRAADLERVPTGAASVVVTRHWHSVGGSCEETPPHSPRGGRVVS